MAGWHLRDYIDDVSDMSDRAGARTIAFFDSVMAIAITLLILEIAIPEAADFSLETASELFVPITAFFISFNVLGHLWLVHVRACSLPRAADVCSPQMHLPLMLLVVLFPKTTELIAVYPHSPLAVGVYLGCTIVMVVLMFVTIRMMLGKLLDYYRSAFSGGSRIKITLAGIKQAAAEHSKDDPAFSSFLDSIESLCVIEISSMAIETAAAAGSAVFLFINPWVCYLFFAIDIVAGGVLQKRSVGVRHEIADAWTTSPELQELRMRAKTAMDGTGTE